MRLRYTLVATTLGAGIDDVDTSITFAAKLTGVEGDVATITSPDYLPLLIGDPDSPSGCEVVHLTDYTTGGITGTILRGQEGSTAQAHGSGARVVNAVMPGDMDDLVVGSGGAGGNAAGLWIGTESEYAAISSPDAHTVYIVTEDP